MPRVTRAYRREHMSDNHSQQAAVEAVEFKGRMLTLSVLRLNAANLADIEGVLAAKVERAPDFFSNMPVLLDVAAEGVALAPTVELLRKHGLVPVAVFEPSPAVAASAAQAGLGVINDPRAARQAEKIAAEPAAQAGSESSAAVPPSQEAPDNVVTAATKIVRTPVRSGQQIYARGGDLVVLGAVSPGAEVLADGNIHIYGALRGRALAGVQGDSKAQIFCSQLSAELVSVAGCYKISEDITGAAAGRAATIFLEGERLEIAPL